MLLIKYSADIEKIMKKFYDTLSEKDKRRFAGIETMKLGHGGQKYICEILECHPQTVKVGIEDLLCGLEYNTDMVRKSGGGPKKIIEKTEKIDEVFFEIIKDNTAGSPMNEEIKWTNLKLSDISKAFKARGFNISEYVVAQLLKKHKFVERTMQKSIAMKETENRNEQFERINELKEEYLKSENPTVSIDVKKKR